MDLSEITFKIKKGKYFVEIDRGYIGFGTKDSEMVERISHYFDWKDMNSMKQLRGFASEFLESVMYLDKK
jgi:hypothetical protein